ncbi:MAG TPA: DUF4012 domain-containing protein, partial [Candidatus Tyrphobacter sp.]|nr:DUF4012 domain-containing protein [Candidatus Tyrphobacter sp.]
MKKRIKRKNIEPVLADVRRGKERDEFPRPPKKLKSFESKPKPIIFRRKSSSPKIVLISAIALSVFILASAGFLFFQARIVESLGKNESQSFGSLVKHLNPFFPAASTFSGGTPPAEEAGQTNLLNKIIYSFNSIESTIADFNGLGNLMTSLNNDADLIRNNWFELAFSSSGNGLGTLLKQTASDFDRFSQLNAKLKNKLSLSQNNSGPSSFVANLDLNQVEKAVLGLNDLTTGSKHLAIVFENSSELRPTGGKIESYADLSFQNGRVENIDVQNITHPDSLLPLKVLPPAELADAGKWGAGDANWFLDFPTSAAKVLSFLNASTLYSNRGIQFAGLVSMDTKALSDFIGGVDPSLMPAIPAFLTDNSYLVKTLPEAVKEEPSLTPDRKSELFGNLESDFLSKDIMVYFTNPALETFLQSNGVDGSTFIVPYDFNGDYLGIANANPASPYKIINLTEAVTLKSQIDLSGSVTNDLVVANTYGSSVKWYRGNQSDFIRIFTPPAANLVSLSGESDTLNSISGYAPPGYIADPTLEAMAKSLTSLSQFHAQQFTESGLNVFSAWFNTPVSATHRLHLNYVSARLKPPVSGEVFQFVFDKQAGV